MIHIAVGFDEQMCLPIAFKEREEAEAFLVKNPHLCSSALFAYGDVPIDKKWLSNWKKFKERNPTHNWEYTT